MIVYKWTIKNQGMYYPLRNYKVDEWKIYNYSPYEIGKIYKTQCKNKFSSNRATNGINSLTRYIGYHFWKEKTNGLFNKWNNYLEKIKQPKINAILKCEVKQEDIFIQNDYQLVAKQFRVLKEEVV